MPSHSISKYFSGHIVFRAITQTWPLAQQKNYSFLGVSLAFNPYLNNKCNVNFISSRKKPDDRHKIIWPNKALPYFLNSW